MAQQNYFEISIYSIKFLNTLSYPFFSFARMFTTSMFVGKQSRVVLAILIARARCRVNVIGSQLLQKVPADSCWIRDIYVRKSVSRAPGGVASIRHAAARSIPRIARKFFARTFVKGNPRSSS